ncbi:MAG: hypothetical protein J6B07_06600, partial [Opitutales bacterium]|nr:hypothetical protein [Opitutales bacterium]
GFENTIINIENTKFINNSSVSISQDIWGDEYGYGDGGAVYFGASEGYGPITATIKDTQFTGNTANKGGAIVTARDNSTSFVLSENKSILNAGNKALNDARGGFLYASKNSTINFDIANASTYTIGDGSVNCDSIASADNSSTINKTGVGTLVVNGSMQYFTGTLNVNAGTMEANNGLGAKVITIANGATVGVQINGNNMLSNSELAFTNNGTLILSSKAGLEAGDYTVSVANITDYGTTKTYGGVLSGNTFTVANAKQIEAGAEAPTVVENNGIVEITTNENTSVSMAFNADIATVNKVSEVTSDLLQTFGSDFVASGAFDFDVSLEAGDTVVLSFYVGDSTLKLGDFSIYHKTEGSQWESADDISNVSYDGEYLSFIVSHFSSYGYTAVPEPAEWAMILGAIALSFVAYRRRK